MNTEFKTKKEPIDAIISPIQQFIKNEVSGSIVLFACTAIAIILANSPWKSEYVDFWHITLPFSLGHGAPTLDLHHLVNDGLMGIFFFVIGLEIKREVIGGELSDIRKAILPFAAGLGGMLVPAGIYFIINNGHEGANGWGIPMATDIAFALGLLAFLGNKVPLSLKIFLTALAIADDLGAVLVIAIFYTENIHWNVLAMGSVFLGILILFNKLGVRNTFMYGLVGIGGLWVAFLMSGVHATLAGVIAAMAIPARTKMDRENFSAKMTYLLNKFNQSKDNENKLITYEQLYLLESMRTMVKNSETPLQRLEHGMHKLVLFFIMPVFALANAGIELSGDLQSHVSSNVSLGIIGGLVLGKWLGIVGMTALAVKRGWSTLPEHCTMWHIYGVALLAGVGFTMSLFITKLAFHQEELVLQAKLGVIIASILAGFIGMMILRIAIKKNPYNSTSHSL
jgi:Na+:H+ antiporter, NhaA family